MTSTQAVLIDALRRDKSSLPFFHQLTLRSAHSLTLTNDSLTSNSLFLGLMNNGRGSERLPGSSQLWLRDPWDDTADRVPDQLLVLLFITNQEQGEGLDSKHVSLYLKKK